MRVAAASCPVDERIRGASAREFEVENFELLAQPFEIGELKSGIEFRTLMFLAHLMGLPFRRRICKRGRCQDGIAEHTAMMWLGVVPCNGVLHANAAYRRYRAPEEQGNLCP